jgi:hypothetical protein
MNLHRLDAGDLRRGLGILAGIDTELAVAQRKAASSISGSHRAAPP